MESGDIAFLNQLVKSLEDSGENLEKAYEKRNIDKFNQAKKMMLNIQKEISDIIK